jgi:callose synthase
VRVQLLLALGYCDPQHHWYHSDHWLWRKIASNEYRRCAVIESYESVKHVFSRIILDNSGDSYIFPVIFKEIDDAIHQERFMKTFKLKVLPMFMLV